MIEDIKGRALHRAKILEGQMRGVQKMIENEDYCMDILTQGLAIQKSISSLNKRTDGIYVYTGTKYTPDLEQWQRFIA